MHKPSTTKFIKELAAKKGLTPEQVTRIVRSEFEFVAEVIKSGDRENWKFSTVLLANLGKFIALPNMINLLRTRTENKRRRDGTANDSRRKIVSISDGIDDKRV